MPPSGKIFVPEESILPHVIVFNFNFLVSAVSEIMGGSQIYIKGLCAPPDAH